MRNRKPWITWTMMFVLWAFSMVAWVGTRCATCECGPCVEGFCAPWPFCAPCRPVQAPPKPKQKPQVAPAEPQPCPVPTSCDPSTQSCPA